MLSRLVRLFTFSTSTFNLHLSSRMPKAAGAALRLFQFARFIPDNPG